MTFKEMMVETVNMAKTEQTVMYLYRMPQGKLNWGVSARYWDDWLFKAYPGGRMVLSQKGKSFYAPSEPAEPAG